MRFIFIRDNGEEKKIVEPSIALIKGQTANCSIHHHVPLDIQ